jgi:hypothetical protein
MNTYRLYVDGRFVRSFQSRDDAADFAIEHGYAEFEILDQSDAA